MPKKKPQTQAQKARQARLAWRAKHPKEYEKQLRERRERFRKRHPDYWKDWQIANREYVTLKKREYRASKEKR